MKHASELETKQLPYLCMWLVKVPTIHKQADHNITTTRDFYFYPWEGHILVEYFALKTEAKIKKMKFVHAEL